MREMVWLSSHEFFSLPGSELLAYIQGVRELLRDIWPEQMITKK